MMDNYYAHTFSHFVLYGLQLVCPFDVFVFIKYKICEIMTAKALNFNLKVKLANDY